MSERSESIGLSDWLASRSPAPPREMSERLKKIVGSSAATADGLPRLLIGKAIELLAEIGDDRSAAPDLLAADALITYAMEAAAESGNVEDAALHAMREISSAG